MRRSAESFLNDWKLARGVRFHLGAPVLEEITLPSDPPAKAQLLSLPLYFAGQLDRLLAEAFPEKPRDGSSR